MGWFSKSKSSPPVQQAETELWTVCKKCKAHVFKQEWVKGFNVCPQCNFHDRLTYQERLDITIDKDSFMELDADITTSDPLGFVDAKGSYLDKAQEAKTATGMKEAVVTGRCKIGGIAAVVAVMDFRFLGGSLAGGSGDKILLASDYALRHRLPYVIFSASGGARMHEGIVSLMQMAKTCAGIARLNKESIPYISVMTDPTFGGVSASYAMVGDINIAEPGAMIGFAGRRVIEQTIKQTLPDDFQTAEYLLTHGFIDKIVQRKDMMDFLTRVLRYTVV